jgi:hypothetical protein
MLGNDELTVPWTSTGRLEGLRITAVRAICAEDRLREVFPGMPEVGDGMLMPGDGPGLGVDLDEAAAARYPFPEPLLNGAWAPVRRPRRQHHPSLPWAAQSVGLPA